MSQSTTFARSYRVVPRVLPTLRATVRPTQIPQTCLRTTTRRVFTSSTTKSNPTTNFTFTSHARPIPTSNPSTLLQRLRALRFFHNTRRRLNGEPLPKTEPVEAEPQGLTAKMKKLSREYGWSAVGVYFALSALDFPFCYLLVRIVGTDRIGQYEEIVVSNISKVIPDSVKTTYRDWRASMKKAEVEMTGDDKISDGVEMAGWGVEEAEAANKKDASLATQLALAYAIHKSFIFVRVPLTAALTPKIVKMLRGWGWDIGKRTTKEAKALKRAALPPKKPRRRLMGRRQVKVPPPPGPPAP